MVLASDTARPPIHLPTYPPTHTLTRTRISASLLTHHPGVAMMLAVLLTLFTMLFSGLLVNPATMIAHAPPWLRPLAELLPACSFMCVELHYCSFMYYSVELHY